MHVGVPKDRAGAAELFEKAAAQNHPGALYNLGILAIENNGVTVDFPKAAKLFRQAAELGYGDAAYALGLLYRNGSGVEKSDEQAALWIGRAAKDGNVPAQVEYAIMLFNGIGVDKDETADTILYLTSNDDILYLLAVEMRTCRRQIGFALSESFRRSLLETRTLTNTEDSAVVSLRDLLAAKSR